MDVLPSNKRVDKAGRRLRHALIGSQDHDPAVLQQDRLVIEAFGASRQDISEAWIRPTGERVRCLPAWMI